MLIDKFDAGPRRFLRVMCDNGGNVLRACEEAGVKRMDMYDLRNSNKDFADAWEMAKNMGADYLEHCAIIRATEGWDEPVFHQGQQCGVKRKFSDRLLELALKARKPAEYRERTTAEATVDDGDTVVSLTLKPSDPPAAEYTEGESDEDT